MLSELLLTKGKRQKYGNKVLTNLEHSSLNPYGHTKINGFKMFIDCFLTDIVGLGLLEKLLLSNSVSFRVALGVWLSIYTKMDLYIQSNI